MNDIAPKGFSTPYDSAFKSIIKKCPRMALFLINEMFYRTGLINEKYDGTEKVELLDKELSNLGFEDLELDMRIAVYKSVRRTFHMECQSTADGTVILRMVRYDTRTAIEEADYTSSIIHIKLDDSGIVFLRSTQKTPKIMMVVLEAPQGKSVSYQIPVIKMQDYTLDYLIGNKLFILLPFLFFNYEKQLKKVPDDKGLYAEILKLYDSLLKQLKEQVDCNNLNAYEASTLYDALKTVFKALGKTNKAEQEVKTIMGGVILEFSADKYFDAGKAEGRKEGEKNGKKEGKKEGVQSMADLINILTSSGKIDDLIRVANDEDFRESLFKKYAIE